VVSTLRRRRAGVLIAEDTLDWRFRRVSFCWRPAW
jgi:hypothetical protein